MTPKSFRVVLLMVMALALSVPSFTFAKEMGHASKPPSKVDLQLALRDLWVEHIFWVRNVVLDTKSGNKDAVKVDEEQVVQDARDIANSITPYYGKQASDKLFNLLAGHYGAVKEYMNASFSGNKEASKMAAEKITRNAEEISTFLSSANPNWPKQALLSALAAHGAHHMAQIDQIQMKDYSSEAKTWEAMRKHIYVIADTLAEGIVKEFGPHA